MIIKTNNKNAYLISPSEVKQFFGVETDKYVVIDKETNDFVLQEENSFILTSDWVDEEVDGRRFRKVKKDIIAEFGDNLIKEYATTNKVYETLSKKFINTSGVSDVLKNAISNNMNCILFGKGGFGKSEMCAELFSRPELKNRVFIQSLSEATTEEDLFGGINMKKLLDSGEKEFLLHNSFANKEIVIFEEIFDAPVQVLACLKDTLTAKEVRNGNQRYPIKTKLIIGLTNKTYDEVIMNASTEALTQRFPISFKLEYELKKIDIAGLILNRYNNYDGSKLAAIIESSSRLKDLTPRKVLEIAKYIKDLEIRKNRNYNEMITNNGITPVIDYLKHKEHISIEDIILQDIAYISNEIHKERIVDYDSFADIIQSSRIIMNSKINDKVISNILKTELTNLIDNIFIKL